MRKLTGILLLLAGVAAAQEPAQEPVEVRIQVEADDANAPAETKAKLVAIVEEMLATKDPAARDALARKLADLVLGGTVRGAVVDADGRFAPGAVMVRMLPDRGGETIKGSWADGERQGSWQLTRLERDRYRLEARVATTNGTGEQDVTDEGTLAELTKRHAFLDGTAIGFFDATGVSMPHIATPAPDPRRNSVSLPELGLELAEANDDLRHQFWLPVGVGWVVRSVTPDSPAARAGLQPFDLITKVGDAWLERPETLRRDERRAVTLTILRRGKEHRIDLAQAD